jgi:hypothetical protein
MTDDDRVKLWDAINAYVVACGGDPSRHVYGNTPRMNAVSEVERTVDAAHKPISKADEIAVMSLVQSALSRGDVILTWHGDRLVTIDGMFADRTDMYASRALLRDAGIVGDRGGWHWTSEADDATSGRPITRDDEERVRDAVEEAFCGVAWMSANRTALSWSANGTLFAINGYRAEGVGTLWNEVAQALARAGIVPGADGWCWAASVPHAVVHQHLAERAYAEDARFLFDVYQAAMRVKEQRDAHEPSDDDPIGDLCALLDSGKVPADPAER